MTRWLGALVRLAVLLAAVTLAMSRLGLLLHELGGHGGTVVALGGRITEVRLFRFAGGWIRFDVPGLSEHGALLISLGGIAIESLVGAAVWWRCRGTTLGARLVRTLGATLVVHAMTYLAGGTWHGYGDGHLAYVALEDARYVIAILAGAAACGAAYLGARHLFGTLVATMPTRRLAGALAALAFAGAANLGLALVDLHAHRDATYGAIMQPEGERIVARELAEYQAANPTLDRQAVVAQQATLEAAHQDFPFKWMLAIGLVTAAVAGATRSRPQASTAITARHLAIAVAVAALATVCVVAVDGFTRPSATLAKLSRERDAR